MNAIDRQLDEAGVDHLGISHRNNRYFAADPSLEKPELYDFIYSDVMARATQQLLGDDVFVFYEQYVVKCARTGMSFSGTKIRLR